MTTDITALLSAAEVVSKPIRGLSLYVKDAGTGRGRGAFASRQFRKNELLEVAIRYWALRYISSDEELNINYNSMTGVCAPEQETWFERHGVQPECRAKP
jgi:hypothetical protein